MTEDYKDKLLKYLTGNLQNETGNNIPLLNQETETINKNVYDDIVNILTEDENAVSVVVLGKLYNKSYENYIIYGTYSKSNNVYYGFIYLVDNEFNTIQMITTFASGSRMFPITALNQAEDNNLYGLSYNINETPSTTRVLLFNNIFASGIVDGNYKAILRNDYIVPYNYHQPPYRQNRIIKSPDKATYYIILEYESQERVISFSINVGAENEWHVCTLPISFSVRFDTKLSKTNDNEELIIRCLSSTIPAVYYEYSVIGENYTTNKTIQLDGGISSSSQVYSKDLNHIYIYAGYSATGKGIIYRVNNQQLIKIYEVQALYGDGGYYINAITLFDVNDGVFFYERVKNTQITWQISIGYIKDDNNYVKEIIGTYDGTPPASILYGYVDFYYKSEYNLVNMYFPFYSTTNTMKKLVLDYNYINYNGNEYEDKNALIPTKARLYDENNKIIFARNLYNKTINSNTTVSTVNIPNINLNNISIYGENLISNNNYILITKETEITKNIYETLNINFHNTIRMTNENDPNNIIFTQEGSNRINISVSDTADYEQAKVNKIRINYDDETTKIQNVTFYPLKNYFYTMFTIYVDKDINNIEFISNDENTVYNTINPIFEVGKYYTIRQSVTIDNKIATQPVLYNNEQIYYNNEEVYY